MNTTPYLTIKQCLRWCLGIALLSALIACSTTSPRATSNGEPNPKTGVRLVALADDFLGAPYVWGGETPRGFDCSGLVYYVYGKLGISVPRTTREQFRHARRVRLARLQPGDLVFFTTEKRKVSHVGIYAGAKRFIHAPRAGKQVMYARLDNAYWSRRFVSAGRLHF